MSKFHNYSFNNTLLIAMQKPDASLIAGFTAWKNQFQRNVKKGEKGIKIIAPSPFKIKQETEKIDPQTQKPVIGRDGKPVTEEKEITIPAYKVVSVFDVSQTEGKELPDIAVDALTGDVERYSDFFAALEKTSPVPIGFEKIEGGAHGYAAHFRHVREQALPADTVTLFYERGERSQPTGKYFSGSPDPQYGAFLRFEVQPNAPEALRDLLQEERRSREQLSPGDFKAHIAALRDGLIEAEARRIVAEMKRQYSPNSPNKTHYMTELAPAFMMLASSRDTDRLFSLLPYKTLTFSKIEGRHGIYALIDKNENRDRDIRKPRPSIRAQLAADKKKAAPKRAAKTKHHEMEV